MPSNTSVSQRERPAREGRRQPGRRRVFVGSPVEGQRVVRKLIFDPAGVQRGVRELLQIGAMVPVQMREQDRVDVAGRDAFRREQRVDRPSLLLQAVMMVFHRTLGVRHTGIDQIFFSAAFDQECEHRQIENGPVAVPEGGVVALIQILVSRVQRTDGVIHTPSS